jgi:hypothetical protein
MVLVLSRVKFSNAFLINTFRAAHPVNWCFFDFNLLKPTGYVVHQQV